MPIGPGNPLQTRLRDPNESFAYGRRRAELDAKEATDGYRPRLIPCPPFRDDADRDAALGAALVMVGHQILGRWPDADSIARSVEVLNDPTVLADERRLDNERVDLLSVLAQLRTLHLSYYEASAQANHCGSCKVPYPCPTAKVIGEPS